MGSSDENETIEILLLDMLTPARCDRTQSFGCSTLWFLPPKLYDWPLNIIFKLRDEYMDQIYGNAIS